MMKSIRAIPAQPMPFHIFRALCRSLLGDLCGQVGLAVGHEVFAVGIELGFRIVVIAGQRPGGQRGQHEHSGREFEQADSHRQARHECLDERRHRIGGGCVLNGLVKVSAVLDQGHADAAAAHPRLDHDSAARGGEVRAGLIWQSPAW